MRADASGFPAWKLVYLILLFLMGVTCEIASLYWILKGQWDHATFFVAMSISLDLTYHRNRNV